MRAVVAALCMLLGSVVSAMAAQPQGSGAFAPPKSPLSRDMALSIFKKAGELYAVTPRESVPKLLMFPQDWLTYFPPETCAIKLRDDSKPDVPKIHMSCPKYIKSKYALDFFFEGKPGTTNLSLTGMLVDTVAPDAYEYEQFVEDPANFYGTFQSVLNNDETKIVIQSNRRFYPLLKWGTLRQQLMEERTSCFAMAQANQRVSVFCGKPDPNSDGREVKFSEPFMMYFTMAEDDGWLLERINIFKTNGDLAGSRTGMDIMRYLSMRMGLKL